MLGADFGAVVDLRYPWTTGTRQLAVIAGAMLRLAVLRPRGSICIPT